MQRSCQLVEKVFFWGWHPCNCPHPNPSPKGGGAIFRGLRCTARPLCFTLFSISPPRGESPEPLVRSYRSAFDFRFFDRQTAPLCSGAVVFYTGKFLTSPIVNFRMFSASVVVGFLSRSTSALTMPCSVIGVPASRFCVSTSTSTMVTSPSQLTSP